MQRVGVRAQLSIACRYCNNTTPVSYLAAVVALLLNHARVVISIYVFICLRADLRDQCLIKKILQAE
jgi:hypothetical protein